MSPSWRECFEIALRPQEVAVRRISAGLRPEEQILVQPVGDAQGPEDVMGELIDQLARVRKMSAVAEVVLTESFARYTLVPWSPHTRGKEERNALLRACFEDFYGEKSQEWAVAADRGKYGTAAPAYAADKSFIDRIGAVLAKRRIHLTSVTPFFSAVFNRYRCELSAQPSVLAVADAGWGTLATFIGGQWHSLRSLRLPDTAGALCATASREPFFHGLAADTRISVCSLDDCRERNEHPNLGFLAPWGATAQPGSSVALLTRRWPK